MSSRHRPLEQFVESAAFVGLNVVVVAAYCFSMVGRLEPLKHEPERFVILPLVTFTALVSVLLYPVARRPRSRSGLGLALYLGFVLVAVLYGVYLWVLFPDAPPWAVVLAVVGAHLYGLPVFLAVLLGQLLLWRWRLRRG